MRRAIILLTVLGLGILMSIGTVSAALDYLVVKDLTSTPLETVQSGGLVNFQVTLQKSTNIRPQTATLVITNELVNPRIELTIDDSTEIFFNKDVVEKELDTEKVSLIKISASGNVPIVNEKVKRTLLEVKTNVYYDEGHKDAEEEISFPLNIRTSDPTTWTVCSSGCDYSSIQAAVSNVEVGDSIDVGSGTYDEIISVSKSLNIYGRDGPSVTIVKGFSVEGDYINISGFTISGGSMKVGGPTGVYLQEKTSHSNISNNIITSNDFGIRIHAYSPSNIIENNTVNKNRNGIYLEGQTRDNLITKNTISSNDYGVYLLDSRKNLIYYNNFIDNEFAHGTENPVQIKWPNNWYHPTLKEGNYWDDYEGVDDGSGTNKHSIAGDGIGDTSLPELDPYPFVNQNGWITTEVSIPPTATPLPTTAPPSTVVPTTIPAKTTMPVTTSLPKTQSPKVTEASSKSEGSGLGWIFLIALIVVVVALSKKDFKTTEHSSKPSVSEPKPEALVDKPLKPSKKTPEVDVQLDFPDDFAYVGEKARIYVKIENNSGGKIKEVKLSAEFPKLMNVSDNSIEFYDIFPKDSATKFWEINPESSGRMSIYKPTLIYKDEYGLENKRELDTLQVQVKEASKKDAKKLPITKRSRKALYSPWCTKCNKYKGRQVECPHCGHKDEG